MDLRLLQHRSTASVKVSYPVTLLRQFVARLCLAIALFFVNVDRQPGSATCFSADGRLLAANYSIRTWPHAALSPAG